MSLTDQSVISGSYSIIRPLLFLVKGTTQGSAKNFINFALSPQGQLTIQNVGNGTVSMSDVDSSSLTHPATGLLKNNKFKIYFFILIVKLSTKRYILRKNAILIAYCILIFLLFCSNF